MIKAPISLQDLRRSLYIKAKALQIDDWQLPQEFCLHTGSIPHRLLKASSCRLRGEFLQAMINGPTRCPAGPGYTAAR